MTSHEWLTGFISAWEDNAQAASYPVFEGPNALLFGTIGITVWAVQMMWIPFWAAGVVNGHDLLAAMKDWIHEAEASGIQSLGDFAGQLETYSLRPASV